MRQARLLFILFLLSIAFTANAHEINENGKANLLIHIDPDDVAVVDKPTTIHIDLKNSDKNFNLEGCNCTFTINQVVPGSEEKQIFQSTLIPSKEVGIYNTEGIPFTFKEEGEYHINVSGEPKIPNLFKSFELEIEEKVLPIGSIPVAMTNTHSHKYPIAMLVEALIFSIFMGYFFFSNKKPFWIRS